MNAKAAPNVPVTAFLGLGSNLGDRARRLREAASLLDGPEVRVRRRSRIYETPPWGKTDQAPFLNQVLEVETSLSPHELLRRCGAVEQALGRVRAERWGPRTIDVDILLYGDRVIRAPDLVVPHAELHRRAFALAPLVELEPDLRLPGGDRAADLLESMPDRFAVRPVDM